jgi:hypothetical protein
MTQLVASRSVLRFEVAGEHIDGEMHARRARMDELAAHRDQIADQDRLDELNAADRRRSRSTSRSSRPRRHNRPGRSTS